MRARLVGVGRHDDGAAERAVPDAGVERHDPARATHRTGKPSRTVISQGYPLAYGTRLYTDFAKYDGTPSPYVGNGIIAKRSNGKPVGHCMMIIGYDDKRQAVYIQNSFGSGMGQRSGTATAATSG